MAEIEIRLPKMGESVTEATITNWLKEVGDTVELDEPLVEVATDKVDNELPSEVEGVLIKKLFEKDEVAQVGDVIALIASEGEATVNSSAPVSEKIDKETIAIVSESIQQTTQVIAVPKTGENGRFFSPLVRSIAAQEGISANELNTITGSGESGRVTKKDILAYLKNGKISETQAKTVSETIPNNPISKSTSSKPAVKEHKTNIPVYEGDEVIEMDRMRRLIADHMVMSVQTAPHVTSYVEADVTNLVNWRNKVKASFAEREGEKMTFTPIFMEAVIKAIKDFPLVNVCVDGNKIIKRKNINLGMATALPSGNLIVPVIHNADTLNLTGLAKQVNKLAKNARNSKLTADQVSGGTYTITNVGTFGNVMGTPIINQPQVAILAVGAIRKTPAVIETPEGDFIGIRHKMYLSHSYDHRVVDGALGGMFVKRVAEYLEQFDVNREL